MDWRLVTELVGSLGYGLLSSFVPVANSEVYILATQTLGLAAEITAAVGVAVGQTIGKLAIVLGLRHGTTLTFLPRITARLTARTVARTPAREGTAGPPGRVRSTVRRWSARMLDLVGDPRRGVLIVFLSSLIGIPPLLAVQFVVPATRMPAWVFGVVVLCGRLALFLALAFGASALVDRLWP